MSQNSDSVRNGHVQIHISEDLMKAEVDLFPPVSGGAPITVMTVVSELEAAGVTWGINKKGLEKNLLRCLTEEISLKAVLAASGQKVDKSVPSYWHLKKRLIAKSESNLDTPNVDYKDKSPYIMVKQGESLAKLTPESPGATGRNIAGDILPISEKELVLYMPGEHIIEKDGILYAACHGRFEIREREMSVNETLEIQGNVDYSTGHIAFPGDVIIHGAVCDGFRVAAGKSIFVKQTMDASKVLSRGDLVVEGGIKGRADALVRVDGKIQAKFIENVSVEAHGNIVVDKAVMHSNIFTLATLDLGEAGVLIGGEVWAMGGIRTGRVGRPESPAVKIQVGSDYIADRKLQSVREQIDRLETKLDKLKSKPTIDADKITLIQQVDDVLEKMRASEAGLGKEQNRNPKARVTVFGEVAEGTEIWIGGLSLRLSSPMEGVVFYYESEGPRIASRNIIDSDKSPLGESNDSGESDPAGAVSQESGNITAGESSENPSGEAAENETESGSADTAEPSGTNASIDIDSENSKESDSADVDTTGNS